MRTKRGDEVRPVDPVKAIWNWRRRGFSGEEIVREVAQEMLSARGKHPVTHAGCVAILKRLGAL